MSASAFPRRVSKSALTVASGSSASSLRRRSGRLSSFTSGSKRKARRSEGTSRRLFGVTLKPAVSSIRRQPDATHATTSSAAVNLLYLRKPLTILLTRNSLHPTRARKQGRKRTGRVRDGETGRRDESL